VQLVASFSNPDSSTIDIDNVGMQQRRALG
jgi:hypothetical protein